MDTINPRQPSVFTKITAFVFLAGGLLSFLGYVTRMSVETMNAPSLQWSLVQDAVIMIASLLYVLAGWYLMKLKKWAYILGLVLVCFSLGAHALFLIQTGTTIYYSLALAIALLALLIIGRKDFK